MSKNIILLDGAKGAGKSTVSNILASRLQETVFLSLDNERRSLTNQQRMRAELNKEAFENIVKKTKMYLKKGQNIVIDCGLNQERVATIDILADEENAQVRRFFLKAPYDILLERVRGRDKAKGTETDEARFQEVFQILHAKDFSGFKVIETVALTPEEISNKIIETLNVPKSQHIL